uniref:Unannotated protein n=1 Tax=freshwater metagenome TaxID=449393 RepID=A0A6J7P853_9ZZZZ
MVEQLTEVCADLWVRREETDVLVDPGRPGVVVAGTDVRVPVETVVVVPDH